MESNYSNRDFEQFVKQNADEYRMFPSEKVWKGIHNTLHTRRRWSGFGLAFLLLMTGTAVTWVMTVYPVTKKINTTTAESNQPLELSSSKPTAVKTNPASSEIKNILPFGKQEESDETLSPLTVENTATIPSIEILEDADKEVMAIAIIPQQYTAIRSERERESIVNTIKPGNDNAGLQEVILMPVELNQRSVETAQAAEKSNTLYADLPLTIESITNAYQHSRPKKKVGWQVFITPTISYRKLSVNDQVEAPGAATYPFAGLSDVNEAVTHKPDLGVQLGLAAHYPLSRTIRLRGGFQFNINRYDIKAFAYNGEVATINLNGSTGTSSVSTWTRYRNFNGYKSDWLKNFYFSVSAPVGAEVQILGNQKTNFGVAGTIQPTYIISDRAYLISTDYKNYAKVPSLIRHVNVSTGFEAFVNYTSGKTKWQVGPQVRYQMLSSFQSKYPVKENLFDFGLKLGLMLNE